MRNFLNDSDDKESNTRPGAEWTRRSLADFKSLLLELARAYRAVAFYPESDPRRTTLSGHAHRALSSELRRGGTLEFRIDPCGFHLEGTDVSVECTGPLVQLQEALQSHGLERLHFDPSLTPTALDGLLDQLGQPDEASSSAETFAAGLTARDSQGIAINDQSPMRVAASPSLEETPRRARATATHSLSRPQAPVRRPDSSSETLAPKESPKPRLEDEPLLAMSSSDRGERLRARLIELHATSDDDEYRDLAADLRVWTEDLPSDEMNEEAFRALRVFADHAIGGGGRTETQARIAAASFSQLATGDRLENLIDRAQQSSGTETSLAPVRAAQLLLQLGESVVPPLFDRLCAEPDPDRAAPLRGLILTQGETALPSLISEIQGQDMNRAREAIRLAGEIQSPQVLPILLDALNVPELARRIETIRALSLLPGEESKKALTEALTSDLEEIAAAASEALATTEGESCIPALLDVLEASLHTTRTKLGTTLVSVLGRIGDERAVPRLCSILERRPVMRRAHWHAIQLATVDALAILPTKEARRSLERAAMHAPMAIRDRAQGHLDRPPRPSHRIASTNPPQ